MEANDVEGKQTKPVRLYQQVEKDCGYLAAFIVIILRYFFPVYIRTMDPCCKCPIKPRPVAAAHHFLTTFTTIKSPYIVWGTIGGY